MNHWRFCLLGAWLAISSHLLAQNLDAIRVASNLSSPLFVTAPPNPPWVDPILDYPHSTGRTVIGGYIYRGAQFPALQGVYVFGDYLGPSGGSAKVFTLNYDGTTASNFQDITNQLFPISR
jgi:hypothetical protein